MQVRIKKLNDNAVIPSYAKDGDAGMDMVATSRWIDKYGNYCYGTGLAIEIPEGYVGLIFPRSSVSKTTMSLCNSIGVIDSGYRGEIIFKFKPTLAVGSYDEDDMGDTWHLKDSCIVIPGDNPYLHPNIGFWDLDVYNIGDKIGQLIILPYPKIELLESEELSDTDRGEGGFGHTGK